MNEDLLVAVLCVGLTVLTSHLFITGDERPFMAVMALTLLSVPLMGLAALFRLLA